MLQVGNGMSVNEDRAHFSMWAMLSAPLIAGNDLRNMSKETLEILTNAEVLAVNQDRLGIQAYRYKDEGNLETWVKPMADGKWAVTFLNRGDQPISVEFDWKSNAFRDNAFNKSADFASSVFNIRNVWSARDEGNTRRALKTTVPGRDVHMVVLTPAN